MFLWDLLQQRQIYDAQGGENSARLKAEITDSRVDDLEYKLDALSLASQAMWELLPIKHGVTERELMEKIQEIDLRDGKQDGKLETKKLLQCPDCGHKTKKFRSNCFWCGAKLSNTTAFIR